MVKVPRIAQKHDGPPPAAKWPDHFCPGCGTPQKAFARYPWYFCQDCLALAEDGEGRRLLFYNVNPLGGFGWCYADDPHRRDERAAAVICLIHRREVVVHEARFGSIVAEPLSSGLKLMGIEQMHVRLTRGKPPETVLARLLPVDPPR